MTATKLFWASLVAAGAAMAIAACQQQATRAQSEPLPNWGMAL